MNMPCHSERSEESRPVSLFCDPARDRARFLASLGMTAFVSWFLGTAGGMSDCHENVSLLIKGEAFSFSDGESKDHGICAEVVPAR
jgi:hypothetical protein